jgi:hypothetical protein
MSYVPMMPCPFPLPMTMPQTAAGWNFICLMLPVTSDQSFSFGNQALTSRIGSLVGNDDWGPAGEFGMLHQESNPLECRGEYSGYERCMKAAHVALTTSERSERGEKVFLL